MKLSISTKEITLEKSQNKITKRNWTYLLDRKEFQKYLNSFKNKFQKKTISTKFTFNLLNKSSFFDESIDNDSDKNMDNSSQGGKTKEEIYYDLLYKRLINIKDLNILHIIL